jgi:hypothetical protein
MHHTDFWSSGFLIKVKDWYRKVKPKPKSYSEFKAALSEGAIDLLLHNLLSTLDSEQCGVRNVSTWTCKFCHAQVEGVHCSPLL